MGIKEPDKRPGFGMTIRKVLGRTSPEENGMLWVQSRVLELQMLHATVSAPSISTGIDRAISVKAITDFAGRYNLDPDELLELPSDQFVSTAAQTKFKQDLIRSIQGSRSPANKLEQTLMAMRSDVERRAKDPSYPSPIHTALLWFQQTGFDEAVRAAQQSQQQT